MAANAFVDPISRIEGHLGVNLTVSSNTVQEADVHGNLWRGFENFLIGRYPNDAITFVQRICGVCPVPHGMTSTYAVEAAIGYNNNFQTFSTVTDSNGVPPKAMYIRNLILGSEFLMSSLTHFYHLAAPSYVQGPAIPPWTPYFNDNYYAPQLRALGHGLDATATPANMGPTEGALPWMVTGYSNDLWSAVITQYVKALRIRRLTFEAGAMFSGRMPMTSALIAGGVGFNNSVDITSRINQFQALTTEIGDFIIREYVPLVLALGALYQPYDNTTNGGSGFGGGCGNFLAWGGFPQDDGSLAMSRGYVRTGAVNTGSAPTNFGGTTVGASGATAWGALPITVADVQSNLKEHITHSRYAQGTADQGYAGTNVAYPGDVSRTIPKRDDATKYSWLKSPRWGGYSMEVGPMARMFVSGIFQMGTALATTVPGYVSVYTLPYTNTGAVSGLALNPAAIHPDLAVACVREGLAELRVASSGALVTLPGTYAAINSAYASGTLVITGALLGWIVGLKAGLSIMDRLRARGLESLVLVQKMIGAPTSIGVAGTTFDTAASGNAGWLSKLYTYRSGATFAVKATPTNQVLAKFGATEAPRGALMHFISINNGKILKYQCVVPTTWNGSPKDDNGNRGPIEQSMIGIPYGQWTQTFTKQDGSTSAPTQAGVEQLRAAQSYDPCIACAVH